MVNEGSEGNMLVMLGEEESGELRDLVTKISAREKLTDEENDRFGELSKKLSRID